jgi:hypothetical protein
MTDAVASDGHGWISRKRVLSALAISIGLMGVAAFTWSGDRLVGNPIKSITSLLEGRSPGERGTATLTKLRKEASKKKREEVHQRVLGKVFPPIPPESVPPQQLLEFGPPISFEELEFPGITLPETAERSSTLNGGAPIYVPLIARAGSGPDNGGSGSGGGGSGGGIGGDIGGGTGEAPTVGGVLPTIPEVSSAVPEPGTWALMLLGSFLSAAALRRDRSRRRRSAAVDTLA